MIIANLNLDYLQYSLGAVAMLVVLYIALRLRRKIRDDMEKEKEQIREWEQRQAEESNAEEDSSVKAELTAMESELSAAKNKYLFTLEKEDSPDDEPSKD